MRYILLLTLALLLCISGAFCQTNNTTIEDLKAAALKHLVVDSSAKLGSYRFSMEIDQNVKLVNLSSGESQKLFNRSIGFGSVNMTDKALQLTIATLTYDGSDWNNSTAIALDEYLINDTIYIKTDGKWMSIKMPAVAAAWSGQNTMEEQVELFNQSRLTLLGSKIIDGQDCYMVRAQMDMATYANQLSGQVESYTPMSSMNYSDLFGNMTLDVYYWITKDTLLLKKSKILESFIVTPQSLGIAVKGPENQEMRVDATISMLFMNFNERVSIELPAEAREAISVPMDLVTVTEAEPIALKGNDTKSENSTAQNCTAQAS